MIQNDGFALFTDTISSGSSTLIDPRQHLEPLGLPILGGLPLGHGANSQSFPLGRQTRLDGTGRTLIAH
jgi:muramoyltetrapeptide carboxypeptidase